MIQKINPRPTNAASAPSRQTLQAADGPEQWGQWSGRKHYSLEVVQHPLRARMCGFGDKDRRPLAPAAVAKMVVKRDDDSLVQVDDIDCSFFLVTVDLWSADGKQEMNLVLHPSSSDRYVPTHAAKPRRRGASTSTPHQRSGHQTPTSRSTPNPSQYPLRPGESQHGSIAPMAPPPAPHQYNNQTYSYPPPAPPSMPEGINFHQPYNSTSSVPPPTWGYDRNTTYPPPALPSIHSLGRSSSPTTDGPSAPGDTSWNQNDTGSVPYRTWNPDSAYPAMGSSPFGSPAVDPSLRNPPPQGPTGSEARDSTPWNQASIPPAPTTDTTTQQQSQSSRYSQDAFSPVISEHSIYASASYAQQHPAQASPYYQSNYAQQSSQTSPPPPLRSVSASTIPPLPRHTYTRTLVGPLSANACRLLDEHRKPGVFFLFQDLSVRTEGTFRLRLRLMNVGGPPAPEAGALRVHTDVSPVLAQTFTEPFVVYSAKRFPGVPDTTALSIALGNQGQKLPLRNRHGSSKQGRRRHGDSGSEDDSDGA